MVHDCKPKIGPSILSADLANLGADTVRAVKEWGAGAWVVNVVVRTKGRALLQVARAELASKLIAGHRMFSGWERIQITFTWTLWMATLSPT